MAKPVTRKPRSLRTQADPLYAAISRNVRILMAENDTTRAELAGALGVHLDTLGHSLSSQRAWTIRDLVVLADFFEVTIPQLLGDTLVVRNRCFRQGEFAFAA